MSTSRTTAQDDLRRILCLARVPARAWTDTPTGFALSPNVGGRIIVRLMRYKRPLSLLTAIEAAMDRWKRIYPRQRPAC